MPDSTATKTARPEANVKETIESILVAFILAFVFRAFVVEAFVIPTGSMAPTLYGAHIRYRCPDCGFTFDAGYKATANSADDDLEIPSTHTPATDYHCPNCSYAMNEAAAEPVRFGDRILVLKYLYLFQKPRQWDVVVFKSPDEQSKHDKDDPEYGMNYIKRLIASGPASVVILDGDVYIAPASSIKTASETGTTVTISTAEPHGFSTGQAVTVAGAEVAEYNGTFTIVRVIDPTTFTYSAAVPRLAASSGGMVTAGTAPASSSIKTVSEIGTTVTISTAEPHGFSTGQTVTVAGVEVATYNGTFTIARVIDPTTFTYTAVPGLAASSGGTVTAGTTPGWKDDKPPFRIQRKPNYVQDALWRVVYNNDFIPHFGPTQRTPALPWTQPWQEVDAGSGWKLSAPATKDWPDKSPSRIFDFANSQGGGAISFHSDANPRPGPIAPTADDPTPHQTFVDSLSDFLVYDENEHRDYAYHKWQPVPVSDLKLSCDYTRQKGDGPLRLQLSKKADVFTAEFTPGKVRLLHAQRFLFVPLALSKETELHVKDIKALSGAKPVRVELSNVDYRVSVRVNGEEVIATTDDEYYPRIRELWKQESQAVPKGVPDPGRADFAKPLVRIEAQRQDARIEHLVLSRDIYYLSVHGGGGEAFWATVAKPMNLSAEEYFVMGDNSFISGDARYWKTEVNLPHEGLHVESGRVPERFMLGKAFFVYWPAGYHVPFTSVNAVPDFGEMRFIR